MSKGFSPLTIAAALNAAQEFVGPFEAVPATFGQQQLVENLTPYSRALPAYAGYTSGFAAETAAEINTQLAKHGFGIRLEEWPPDPTITRPFGVAGITDVTVNWRVPGDPATIKSLGNRYPGFALKEKHRVRVIGVAGFATPMVQIQTQEGLDVRTTMTSAPTSPLELMDRARELHAANANPLHKLECSAVHLPMVKLLQQPNIEWLLGMGLQSQQGIWYIQQALQEVRFAMNQCGARAKEATAFGMVRGIDHNVQMPYVVDQPFLITIGKPDVAVPVFGAYITQDDWQDPGDLTTL